MLYCRSNILWVLDRELSRIIPHLCPFELEIKMADEDEIFRKFRRKTQKTDGWTVSALN